MKSITRFLGCIAVLAVVYGVVRYFCPPSPMAPEWWQVCLTIVFVVSPTLAVMYAVPTGLKGLWRDYLSLRYVKWVPAVTMLATAAVLCPVIVIMLADAGGRLGTDCMGALMNGGSYDMIWFSADLSTIGGRWSVVLYSMLTGLVMGTLSLVNHLFGEIGWRGFLQRLWPVGDAIRPLLVGVVWTLWLLPVYVGGGDDVWMRIALRLVSNIVLSYMLAVVLNRTGSVWVTAAMLGVIEVGTFFAPVTSGPVYAGGIVIAAALGVGFKYLWRPASDTER